VINIYNIKSLMEVDEKKEYSYVQKNTDDIKHIHHNLLLTSGGMVVSGTVMCNKAY